MPSPGLNRTCAVTRRGAYNGGWDGILPKKCLGGFVLQKPAAQRISAVH